MSRKFPTSGILLVFVTVLLLVSLAFCSGFVFASIRDSEAQVDQALSQALSSSSPLGVFQESWDLVERDFFGPLPSNRIRAYGAIRGLINTLGDPYTVFVEPAPRQLEQDNLRGSYGGIGVTLGRDAAGQITLSPFVDSPAAEAGVLEGDILFAVDGLVITPEMDIGKDVEVRIRGEVGTAVTLVVKRDGKTINLRIIRAVIEVPSVTWRVLEQSPSLGYVHITSFTDRTSAELGTGLDELDASGVQGLILDLRDNGGGLLQAAIDVADHFLDGGIVLYETRKGQEDKSYFANSGGQALQIPLTVLVNQGTASASEIVAGAIQDRGRGVLIGETTFGKGSVQLIFDLVDGSSLHVTASRWYTPDRHQLDGVGLTPNLVIQASAAGTDKDTQLERAIAFLQHGR